MSAHEWLDDVLFMQRAEGYCCVSQKVTGWEDRMFPYHLDKELTKNAVPKDRRNLYFCPNLFTEARRREAVTVASRWLYADLDEVEPGTLAISPTTSWETSPGRFQALWYLSRPLKPQVHRKLNQKLTYFCNADKGGWGLTKVLRLPGTISTKHGPEFHIEIPDILNLEYDPQDIWAKVKHVPTDQIVIAGKLDVQATEDAQRLMRKVPASLRPVLRRKQVDDRSRHVYRIVADLRDAGFEPSEAATLALLSPVVMEKYGARAKEQVLTVVEKVYARPAQAKKPKINGHRHKVNGHSGAKVFETASKLLSREVPLPKWLIEGIWSENAHGIIAGEHKTYKSLVALDLAVSVASGTRFLGHFPVPKVGHVTFIQEENPIGFVKDRIEKIMVSRGLSGAASLSDRGLRLEAKPSDLPMSLMNNQKFDLTDEDDLTLLHEHVEEHQTKLVVLDPLYLMTPGLDENSAHQMTPVLQELLRFKHEHDCGVLLIHHFKKQDRDKPFYAEDDRISGTSTFGRWYESLLLIERGSEPGQVRLIPKHRMEAPGGGLVVDFDMGPMGDTYYEPIVSVPKDEANEMFERIKEAIRVEQGITIAELAKEMGIRAERLRRLVERMDAVTVKERKGRQSPKLFVRL